ncbi:MAG: PAAR domain-containing protein [Polyangiaceae bacterium]|nr:PAAR domain-containing protein [Polyangiaceae bacterium]
MPLLPSARKTDSTSHFWGSTIEGPCAANTDVEGLPAARVTDKDACKMPLHVKNPIIWGSETVIIEGLFAARKTDQTLCGAEITGGAANVEIGGPTLKFKMKTGWLPGSTAGNSMVAISTETKNIYILSFLEYSGPDASADYAARAAAQIEAMWGGRTTTIDGEQYTVNVDVTTRVRGPGEGPTSGYDQIIVDNNTERSNQALFGNGDGHQKGTDADADKYVAAHEYGHSLGLPDEYHDEVRVQPDGTRKTVSVPNDPAKTNNIMAETWESGGNPPHPYDNQYQGILDGYDLP